MEDLQDLLREFNAVNTFEHQLTALASVPGPDQCVYALWRDAAEQRWHDLYDQITSIGFLSYDTAQQAYVV